MAMFICLEGIHGAGKTSLALYLRDQLVADLGKVVFSKDQAGTPLSEQVRNLHLDERTDVDAFTETFLVAGARRQTYVAVVRPALQMGSSVITERFVDSFYAYGFARELPEDFIDVVAKSACDGKFPDLTLLIDLPPEQSMQRIPEAARHRIELESMEFHQKLRAGYLKQARLNPNRYIIMDGLESIESIRRSALTHIRSFLKRPIKPEGPAPHFGG